MKAHTGFNINKWNLSKDLEPVTRTLMQGMGISGGSGTPGFSAVGSSLH